MADSERKGQREIREHLIRLLYLRDFHETDELAEQNQLYFDVFLPTEGIEFDRADAVLEKYDRVVAALPEIDSRITAEMQGWRLGRIGLLEKSILRLSVFEMVYDKLPVRVSINEAVELAKIYGREQSYSFVNGVLAKIVKGLDKDGKQSSSD